MSISSSGAFIHFARREVRSEPTKNDSAATLFMIILDKGIAPKAMLFANHIDSLAACGILMGDNWLGKRIVTVDLLGDDFLDAVKTGDKVKVHEDGTIEVG